MHRPHSPRTMQARGFSMVEVLVTLVVIAFGLLALINLQIKMHMIEVESYQRAQAVVLRQDMVNRIQVNPIGTAGDVGRVAQYATAANGWLGVDGAGRVDCGGIADPDVSADACAWENLLRGAAAQQAGVNIGAMIGARGCIEQVQPGDPTDGFCQPAIYRVSIAWQGLQESAVPDELCGAGEYGNEGFRRVISTLVTLGVPGCQ